MLNISLAAEKIGSIGGFPVTNSLLSTWVVMALLFGIALLTYKNVKIIPSNGQLIVEIILDGLYEFFHSVIGHHVKKVFPLLASLFLFIILANWMGLLPGVGTIGFYEEKEADMTVEGMLEIPSRHGLPEQAYTETIHEEGVPAQSEGIHETTVLESKKVMVGTDETITVEKKFVPFFRGATADLNTTIALAIIAFFAIQYFGFQTLGIHYGKRFVNVSNPIMFFVGILEIISDISKVISFAFRLFGNIFAGEVLLAVMAFLMPFIVPLPFLALELFVGFIQALVFSTLTAVFINVAVAHEE